MQLKISTDYAIRIILYLISSNTVSQASSIGKETGITTNYVLKIMNTLKKAGLVKSYRGNKGGYSAIEGANNITLWQLISLMEPAVTINRCLERDGYCSGNRTKTCAMHAFYIKIQEDMEELLKSITMEKVLNGEINNLEMIRKIKEGKEECEKDIK